MAHAVVERLDGTVPIHVKALGSKVHLWKGKVLGYVDDEVDRVASCQTRVLECFSQGGLKLKPSKCCFDQSCVHFLEHVVFKQGIATDPAKVEHLKEWPEPKNVTEL